MSGKKEEEGEDWKADAPAKEQPKEQVTHRHTDTPRQTQTHTDTFASRWYSWVFVLAYAHARRCPLLT